MKKIIWSVMLVSLFFVLPEWALAKVQIPANVYNIEKENTATNSTIDDVSLEPNALARQLIRTSNVKIENPSLVSLLNETQISKNPVAFWYRAKIFLGTWPLNYHSEESMVNWEYEKINTNVIDNRSGTSNALINYRQDAFKIVKGQITPDISKNEDIQNMIMGTIARETGLPIDLEAKVGNGTQKENRFLVPMNKIGSMYAYVPTVLDKGKVTYGDVYLVLKGGKRMIEVKNISFQKVNARFPVQDHISLKLETSSK